jgi:hypothetical protein
VQLKRKLEAGRDRGEQVWARRENEKAVVYARRCIASYSGRGSERVSERTVGEYRRDVENHIIPALRPDTRLGGLSRRVLREIVAELQEKGLADSTVRRVMAPRRAMLADAADEGDLSTNPAAGLRIPSNRPADSEERRRRSSRTSWRPSSPPSTRAGGT